MRRRDGVFPMKRRIQWSLSSLARVCNRCWYFCRGNFKKRPFARGSGVPCGSRPCSLLKAPTPAGAPHGPRAPRPRRHHAAPPAARANRTSSAWSRRASLTNSLSTGPPASTPPKRHCFPPSGVIFPSLGRHTDLRAALLLRRAPSASPAHRLPRACRRRRAAGAAKAFPCVLPTDVSEAAGDCPGGSVLPLPSPGSCGRPGGGRSGPLAVHWAPAAARAARATRRVPVRRVSDRAVVVRSLTSDAGKRREGAARGVPACPPCPRGPRTQPGPTCARSAQKIPRATPSVRRSRRQMPGARCADGRASRTRSLATPKPHAFSPDPAPRPAQTPAQAPEPQPGHDPAARQPHIRDRPPGSRSTGPATVSVVEGGTRGRAI